MKYFIIAVFVGCAVVAGILFTGMRTRSADKQPVAALGPPDVPALPKPSEKVRKYPVRTQTVQTQTVRYEFRSVGNLEPQDTYRIDSQLSGTIYDVTFNEGDEVKSGQVLLRIAPAAYQLVAARDEALYNQAVADLANTKRKITNQIELAKVKLTEAQTEVDRRIDIQKAGSISTEEIQLYKARRDVAKVQLKDAEEAADTEMKVLEAVVAQRDAIWKISLNDVRKSTVLPPIPGKIDKRYVTNGMYVPSGSPLATIVDRRALKLRFKLAERDSSAVKPGDKLEFTVPAWPNQTFEAVVYQISDQVDSDARSVSCLARVENNLDKLIPGYFASVRLFSGGNLSAVVVPATAILTTEKGFVAFVIKADGNRQIAQKRMVKAGLSVTNNAMEILTGLSAGERVVIEGTSALEEGYEVTLLSRGTVVEETSGKE